jgi:hypothetical protein
MYSGFRTEAISSSCPYRYNAILLFCPYGYNAVFILYWIIFRKKYIHIKKRLFKKGFWYWNNEGYWPFYLIFPKALLHNRNSDLVNYAHSLAVETGSYFVNQRISCCEILIILQGIKVENEVHLFLHCPSYKFASQKYSSVHMNSSNIDDIQLIIKSWWMPKKIWHLLNQAFEFQKKTQGAVV